ncbi:MAG: TVP38/TMEM64 family protein [Candidatus Omnitrophica bacterium]|nr:TVP38/TMEM64 family protein [Candidatus Omnitrophota bacterium]
MIGRAFHLDVESFKDTLPTYSWPIAAVIFVAAYVVVTFFVWLVAKDVFRISGAFVFGAYGSTFLIWIAECINAVVLFLFSRRMGRAYIEEKFHLKNKNMDRFKNTGGWGTFALRLNPLVPFRFMDLSYGLTRLPLYRYMVVVVIATLPRVFLVQYILVRLGKVPFADLNAVIEYLSGDMFIVVFILTYFTTLLIVTVVACIMKIVRTLVHPKPTET